MRNTDFEDEDDLDIEDDAEDDEPLLWEELEAKYGRELTEEEVRLELKADYESEFLDLNLYAEEFEEDVARYQDWLAFKEEMQQRDERRVLVKESSKKAAEDVYYALLSPPLDDDGEMPEGGMEKWAQEVNEQIRQKLDFYSLIALESLFRKSTLRSAAVSKAHIRHKENHSMKAEVFDWLDQNMSSFGSMDGAAEAIAGKVVPVAFRTARKWVGEHKKLRSAGTE